MHDSNDPDTIGLIEIYDRIGEHSREVSARGRIKHPETLGLVAHFANQAFHFIVETTTEFGINAGVVGGSLRVFRRGCRMEDVRFHRPTMWRILAETWSPRMPCTAPLSISAMRCRVSCFQAWSTVGSVVPTSSCSWAYIQSRNRRRSSGESCNTDCSSCSTLMLKLYRLMQVLRTEKLSSS